MGLEEMLNSTRLSNPEKRRLNRIKAMMEARDRSLERTLYDSILYKSLTLVLPSDTSSTPGHPRHQTAPGMAALTGRSAWACPITLLKMQVPLAYAHALSMFFC